MAASCGVEGMVPVWRRVPGGLPAARLLLVAFAVPPESVSCPVPSCLCFGLVSLRSLLRSISL